MPPQLWRSYELRNNGTQWVLLWIWDDYRGLSDEGTFAYRILRMKLDELAAQQPKGLEAQKPEPGDHDCAAVAKRKDLIEKMKALAELDRLAAEKVMGWRWFDGHGLWKTNMGYFEGEKYLPYWPNFIQHRGEQEPHPRWQPSRNIAQAWECLEKFNSKSASVHYSKVQRTDGIVWECWIHDDESIKINRAETAPLAIVKACLKAKGVEIE